MIYARAAFELALERGVADEVRRDLDGLAECVKADEKISLFLSTPAIDGARKVEVFRKALAGKIDELTMDFLQTLARRDRLGMILEIRRSYIELEDEKAGRIQGTLITATKLSTARQATLIKTICEKFNLRISFDVQVDPSIMGGIVLKIGNKLIDGSIRKSLDRLTKQLIAGADR